MFCLHELDCCSGGVLACNCSNICVDVHLQFCLGLWRISCRSLNFTTCSCWYIFLFWRDLRLFYSVGESHHGWMYCCPFCTVDVVSYHTILTFHLLLLWIRGFLVMYPNSNYIFSFCFHSSINMSSDNVHVPCRVQLIRSGWRMISWVVCDPHDWYNMSSRILLMLSIISSYDWQLVIESCTTTIKNGSFVTVGEPNWSTLSGPTPFCHKLPGQIRPFVWVLVV